MSWVVEEWKEGLPTKTLHKIQELEGQVDKLKKERQQRQFQLESLQAAIQKQKQKVESEKGEVTALKRENQSLIELCDNMEKTRQRLTQEQQVKDTQLNILEGQLSASKKHIDKLELELKRYKNDLERSQQSFNAGDMSVCVTPQKSVTVSFTPVKFNDPKYEELQEKYSAELEERKRLETELKVLHIKMVNQSSQPSSQNPINHRDIARHQSSSSVFPWQQEPTPGRASSSSRDSSLKRSFPATQCPWEQEETPSKRSFKPESGNRSFCDSYNNSANEQLKNQNQELRSKVTELELQLQVQEKELKNHLHKLQETRTLLEKSQAELAERDKALTKSRDDFARVTAQLEQSADKCAQAEQKLKKVSEELSCQRQNAESARLAVEHKLKEREKENQQELLRQQNSFKNMEQQLNQVKTKLNQESQQAKNEFNAIQAELDRVTHGKRILESEVEELKQKLLRTEQALLVSEGHGSDFRRSLEEAKSQQNAFRSQLDQKAKETLKLEEEFIRAEQTLRQNQLFMDEVKYKNNSLEAELKSALQKLQGPGSASVQHLNEAITKLEKERDFAQDLLKKREHDIEEAKTALAKVTEESQALKNQLDSKERECKDLASTNSSLKREHKDVTDQLSSQREEKCAKVKDLESVIQMRSDQINVLDQEKKDLHTQIKALQDQSHVNTADLDIQKVTCASLQHQLESDGQKSRKEMGDLMKKISELEAQREAEASNASSDQMLHLESELEQLKKLNGELKSQNEKLLESQTDIQKKLLEVEEMQERFASESRSQFESFQDNISSKQNVDSLVSAIKEKDEEISLLSEKLRLCNADVQSSHWSNQECNEKLQELSLLRESWSTERKTLTALIASMQRDLEQLTAEPKTVDQFSNLLKYEEMQLRKANADLMNQEATISDVLTNMEEGGPVDVCSAEITKENDSIKPELAEWKENLCRTQEENNRLLAVNKELSALVEKLQNNELSLNKIIEDLRVCLKDEETSIKNTQAKFEKLNPDHEDNENPAENLNKLFNNLQRESDHAESNNNRNLMTQTPESAKEKNKTIPRSIDQILMMEDCDEHSVNYSNLLVDVTEGVSPFQLTEPQNRCENETLLINLDQLTLASDGDSTRTLPVFSDLGQLPSQQSTALSPSMENSAGIKRETPGNRRSITAELIDALLRQSPQQRVLFSGMENENACDLKDLLTCYQMELSNLQKQHLAEHSAWQQKLKDQALEMETRLAAEMAQTDCLSRELDAARLELQVLNLSARSLLSFDSDDLTTRSDPSDLSICTFLPMSSLSLGNAELRSSEYLKHGRQSPEEANAGETVDVENVEMISHGNVLDHTGNNENSSREKKRRKDSNSEFHVDNLEAQVVSEFLPLKSPETLNENRKLLQVIHEKEQINQTLLLEVKGLSTQIEKQRAELTGKERENRELGSKSEELQTERLELLTKMKLICNEKLHSASRIADLEKELQNTLNTMEMVKAQMSELSGVRESLEISSKEWKENYLQAESELRRIQSEKANIEAHALSLEADLDALHAQCQRLQEESKDTLNSLNDLQEHLNAILAQKSQINQELETLLEEKEDLEQTYKKLKEREAELESSKLGSKELIKILEADIRTLKEELQAAKSTAEQLIAEHDEMARSQENERTQHKELQSLVQHIQEEKNFLRSEQDALQARLSAAQGENGKLSRALECCQFEKHGLASRLSSAQEEVALMRTGIEKLKVKIESDERKQRRAVEKLKESERRFDRINDRVETLERELLMTEENLENAILQTEAAKEEAESLSSQKETLEIELNCIKRKLGDLEKEHLSSQEKIADLEATIVSVTNTLESREVEHSLFRDNSEEQHALLHTRLEELHVQKALSDHRYEAATAEHADMTTRIEQHKAQLEEAKAVNDDLKMSVERLALELEECKVQLSERTQQLAACESQCKEADEREMTYSAGLSLSEAERETLINEKKSLQTAVEELEARVRTLSAGKDSLQAVVTGLEASCSDLEAQLESAKFGRQALVEQVTELEGNCSSWQSRLQDADVQMKATEEQNCSERKRLDVEIQTMRRQHEESSALLLATTSETADMENTVTSLQGALESQAQKHKDDIMEYEKRLLQADSRHQSLLNDMVNQHKGDIDRYQEKLTSVERLIIAHRQEIDCLKGSNGELRESLCKAQGQLAELTRLKVVLDQLKKENATSCKNLHHWINSCRELEREKEHLQKQVSQQEKSLRGVMHIDEDTTLNTSANDPISELEELRRCLEEKTLEAEESVDKYCNLLIKSHKLEDANDMLKKQLDFLSSRLRAAESKIEGNSPSPASDNAINASDGKGGKSSKSAQGPVKCAPMKSAPVKSAQGPVKSAPVKSTQGPVKSAPVKSAQGPVKSAQGPVKSAPVKSAQGPVKSAPVKSAQGPVKSAQEQGKSAPVKSAQGPGKSAPVKSAQGPMKSAQGPGKQANKRQRESDDTGHNPTTPQCVTKKVKKTGIHTTEEDKFEPEGLPEVVKKGFADIPSGKRSPFILRRTAVPLRKSPRLHSQTNSPSISSTQMDDLENLADLASPPAGGSKSYTPRAVDTSQLRSDLALMHVSSPLSTRNKLTSQMAENPCTVQLAEDGTCLSALHDQSEEEGTCHVQ